MLKSFKMSSYIWALVVLIWMKNVYSWPNVHILLCLVLLLWKKKKGPIVGQKTTWSFSASQKDKWSGQPAAATLWKQKVMDSA